MSIKKKRSTTCQNQGSVELKNNMSRRKFIGSTAVAAGAFTIVPKHVLGFGQPAPSDKIVMAHIGCGTQGHNELGPLINSPDLLTNA